MSAISSGPMGWAMYLSYLFLIMSFILTFIRFVKGPSIADRIVAFDLMVIIMMGIIILFSIRVSKIVFLDAVIIMALISFLGTVAYARYLEKGASK